MTHSLSKLPFRVRQYSNSTYFETRRILGFSGLHVSGQMLHSECTRVGFNLVVRLVYFWAIVKILLRNFGAAC